LFALRQAVVKHEDREVGLSATPDNESAQKLLVSGCVCLAGGAGPVALRRLMRVQTVDGESAGVVAAVVLAGDSREITHFLLGSVPPTAIYRLVPLALIAAIDGETVRIRIDRAGVAGLPAHQMA
jgi:hypothetical protein